MTISFTELGLETQLTQTVAEIGYLEPTPIQAEIVPLMLKGHDVIGQAQTGTGKTAAFMLPVIQKMEPGHHGIQALVMAPTRELAVQIAHAATQLGRGLNVRVLAVYGGQPYGPQIDKLRRGVDLVVGTPGRLKDLMAKGVIDLAHIKTIVLDEADEMLSMGFIEDMEEILSASPAERQTALFSATMSPRIGEIAGKYMKSPRSVNIKSKQLTVDGIEHKYCLVNEAEKKAVLTRIFEIEDVTRAVVFVNTRAATSELVDELNGRGFPAEGLNGDLDQQEREKVLNRFRRNQITTLVATDVAARGLDIDDVSHVFNYDLPIDPEMYVHRVGRTGRAGKKGIAVSLLTTRQQWHLHRIEGFTKQPVTRVQIPSVDEIEKRRASLLLKEMVEWLESGRYDKESILVSKLAGMGYDPLHIAAASIKVARGEDKHGDIAPVSDVQEVRVQKARHVTGRSQSRGNGRKPDYSERRGKNRFSHASGKDRRERTPTKSKKEYERGQASGNGHKKPKLEPFGKAQDKSRKPRGIQSTVPNKKNFKIQDRPIS